MSLLGKGFFDKAEQGIEAFFLFKEVKDGLGDLADAVGVIALKHGHLVDHAVDGDKLGRAHLIVGGGDGDHHGDKGILRRKGGGLGHQCLGVGFAADNIDACAGGQ
jgi:hypothetical protein